MSLRLRGLAWHTRVRWDHCPGEIRSGLPCKGSLSSFVPCPPVHFSGLSLEEMFYLSSLMPVWIWLALCFFSIKNVLFLVHCVKTRASHPVYVCARWNSFPSPEGLSGLFSYMCWSSVCFASHCMQTQLRNAVHQPWGHQAWMAASFTNHSPSHLPFLSYFCLCFTPSLFLSSCLSRWRDCMVHRFACIPNSSSLMF